MNVGGPFVLNIDPVLLDIGGIRLWYYGLAYALGFFGIFSMAHEKTLNHRAACQ